MEKQIFHIPNISCGHCTKAIENELSEMDGIIRVQGDAGMKSITVEWDAPVTRDKILACLKEINYPAAS